jgi:hypothetical protein
MGEVIDPFANSSEEDFAVRQEAGRAGWSIDDDGWFWRDMGPNDPDLETVTDASGFCCEGKVYMPDCRFALAYDRGITKFSELKETADADQ